MDPSTHRYSASSETAYGQGPDGSLQHVATVANGERCNCVCLECGHTLIAHQGSIAWHFQHKARADCPGGTILLRAARIMLVQAAERGEALGVPALHEFLKWRPSATSLTMISGDIGATSRSAVRAGIQTPHGTIAVTLHNTDHHQGLDDAPASKWDAALEIDLSGLSALTAPDALRDAVLASAPRRWAIRPSWRLREPVARSSPSADPQSILQAVLTLFSTEAGRADPRIPWPESAAPGHRYGRDGCIRLYSVAITTTMPRGTRYRTTGQVVEGESRPTQADVLFTFENAQAMKRSKPGTLIIQCPDSVADDDWPARLTIVWGGARRWPLRR